MTKRLVLALVALTAAVAIALAVPLGIMVDRDQRSAFVSGLQVDTLITASQLAAIPESAWQATVSAAAERTGARIVVVRRDLTLAADSDLSALDRSFDRPEIERALAGDLSSDIRSSATLGGTLRFVAAPVVDQGKVVAAVRLSLPESEVDAVVAATRSSLMAFILSVVLGAALVAWLLARSLTAPLHRLAGVARRLPDDLALRGDDTHGPGEVRQVAAALNATAGRLGDLVNRQQRVAADASHHLRTPLTGIRLRLEAIEDLAGEEAVRSNAAAALSEVDRLARRLDQVLELARNDSGTVSTQIHASTVIKDRIATWQTAAAQTEITLTSSVTPDLVVQAPVGVLDRVVDELVGNALKFAHRQVDVQLTQMDGQVRLTVTDDGPGLAEDERETVFERFTRGSQAKPGGSGLGLALVRESSRAAGGDTIARASPTGGLEITTRWPT